MTTELKIRVLLMDDETEFLESTKRALDRRGFVVDTAATAAEALALAEDPAIEVCVLDVKMPDIDGHEVFRRLKEGRPGLPVIMLTGHGTIDRAFEISKEGAADYLTKPVDIELLAAAIRGAVEAKGGRGFVEPAEIRVLVVDDETEYLDSLERVLGRRGMLVRTARNGEEGLEIARASRIDVAVLDIKMPGLGGLEVLERLRSISPPTRVILLTGHGTLDSAVEGMKRGAYDYLLKPQDPDDLAARIRAAWREKMDEEEARRRSDADDIARRIPG